MFLRLVVLSLVLSIPAVAFADGSRVRFSYSKTQVGGEPMWVLMPVAEKVLGGKITNTTYQGAFNLLRKNKRSTYGGSSLSMSGKKAKVKIDSGKAKFAPIIIAETVYTLTELGAKSVEFPGFTTGALTRADVPYPGFTLTVPLWRGLGLSSPSVLIQMPSGELLPSKQVAAQWKSKDQNLINALYQYLNAKDSYTVTLVAKKLPTIKVPYVEQVTQLLTHQNKNVRKTALEILADQKKNTTVLAAVKNVMLKDKDPEISRAAANYLGESKNKEYAVQKNYYLLAKGSDKEKLDATKALAKSNTPETIKLLEANLTHKSQPLAEEAAVSLAKLNANDAQKRGLTNSKIKPSIRLAIAKDLAEDKNAENSLVGAAYVANNDVDDFAIDAIKAVGASNAPASRAELERLLAAPQEARRLEAADQLAQRKDAQSLTALAKAIRAGKNAKEMEQAGYAIMVAQNTKTISEKTTDKDNLVQRLAYRALGEKAAKEKSSKYFNVLKAGLTNRDPLIRGASARAVGRYGNKAAANALKGMTKDKNENVRADVAYAIGYLPDGELTEELKTFLGDKSAKVQAGAISSLGRRGEAFAWDQIKGLASSRNPEVRAAAAEALAKLVSRDDKQGVREVISMLSGRVTDDDSRVQIAAITQLGTFRDEKAVTAIALQLNADDEALRLATIEALGTSKHPAAVDLLTSVLDDRSRRVRQTAVKSIGVHGDPSAKPALKSQLSAEKDASIQSLIKSTLKKL